MALHDITSHTEFTSAVKSGQPAVAHFWAAWCEPCKHMDTVLRQLAAENTRAKFLRVRVIKTPKLFPQISIRHDLAL